MKKYFQEFKYNFNLAMPVILGMVGHTLVGVVDNIFVGQIGTTELAAVSLGNSFIFIGMSIGIGFSTAITPIIAEFDSTKDREGGRSAFQNGLILCTILGFALFFLLFLAKPILSYMNQPEDVVKLAMPFLDIVGFSLVPLVIFQAYKQFADGMSETKYSMYATIYGNIINVVINALLVFGLFMFPKMGIVGSAIGTLIARVFMVIYMHYILSKNKKFKSFFQNFGWQSFQKSMSDKIIKLGIPSSMQMFFEVALFTGAIWLSGIIGKTSQAANQIALNLASITFMFAMGLSVTAMIRVATHKSLNEYKKLNTVAHSIFLMVIIIEIVFAVIFMLGSNFFPMFFVPLNMKLSTIEIKEVLSISSKLLIVAAFFQISDGIQVVVLGALRGLQDVKVPMYLTFVAYWMIGFPISIYLGLYTELKAEGVWIGLLAGLTAAAIMLYLRFRFLLKHHR
ncbi:MATE family efflux transporter [Flavobacterium sp. F372]|jgi:MATE family multidrug resistance protein|uniref:Multidrug-efflux transporter n=1 Tax=Flavobacterium bernardetii TaxID=2813823 RepID=A0ABR7IUC8_9FLAO|nr:MATE family efflux transporter [Flavobacterium bernardetii]MBC5833362.1 MATE family efflux transporter [Flavobacterium bernardetii]NHF68594.1 MATE family efflux transporter [Flavobacterium bernardetii]